MGRRKDQSTHAHAAGALCHTRTPQHALRGGNKWKPQCAFRDEHHSSHVLQAVVLELDSVISDKLCVLMRHKL